MKCLVFALTIVSAVSLGSPGVVRADPVPAQGTRELRLGSSPGALSVYGPGFSRLSPESGSNTTIASIGVGMGYFVTENVELGGSVGYFYISQGGGTVDGPGLSGFLRLYSRTGNTGLFVEPTLDFQYLSQSSVTLKLLGIGADVGVEFFLANSWALRLSPTFRYYKEWASSSFGSDDSHATKIGLNWGISAYF
jgi:hypothetical protein